MPNESAARRREEFRQQHTVVESIQPTPPGQRQPDYLDLEDAINASIGMQYLLCSEITRMAAEQDLLTDETILTGIYSAQDAVATNLNATYRAVQSQFAGRKAA